MHQNKAEQRETSNISFLFFVDYFMILKCGYTLFQINTATQSSESYRDGQRKLHVRREQLVHVLLQYTCYENKLSLRKYLEMRKKKLILIQELLSKVGSSAETKND